MAFHWAMLLYQGRIQQTKILYWATPSSLVIFNIREQPPEYPGARTTQELSEIVAAGIPVSKVDSQFCWAWHTSWDWLLVCQVIGLCFNLETPGSLSLQEWCHKEKQFYNCPADDGMVKGNQLCKLWDVSHTSICTVTVWKLELYFVNMRWEPETTCNVLCPNYLRCAPLHPWFFSHLTFSIVLNLIKESNRIEVYMWPLINTELVDNGEINYIAFCWSSIGLILPIPFQSHRKYQKIKFKVQNMPLWNRYLSQKTPIIMLNCRFDGPRLI